MASYSSGAPHTPNAEMTLPKSFDFGGKPVGQPARAFRTSIVPRSGSQFGGSKLIQIDIPAGNPGVFMDPSTSYLQFAIANGSAHAMELDASAASVIEKIDVYMGSVHLSSMNQYAVYHSLIFDNQVSLSDKLTSYTQLIGAKPLTMPAAYNAVDVETAVHQRKGQTIAVNSGGTFCLPLLNVLGTMSQRAIPLGQLRDDIRVDITLNPTAYWGVWTNATPTFTNVYLTNVKLQCAMIELASHVTAGLDGALGGRYAMPIMDVRHYSTTVGANSGAINYLLPARVSSASAVFVTMRASADVTTADATKQTLTKRTRGTMTSYSWRLGAHRMPQIPVVTDTNIDPYLTEARMELARAFQSVGLAAQPSSLSQGQWVTDGFAVGLSLDSFAHMNELMSDGVSLLNSHLYFEATLAANNPALVVDFFVLFDKVVVCEGGLLSYAE